VVVEILSYKTSFLNPLVKLIIVFMFAIGTWFFYRAAHRYGGNLREIARLIMWGGLFGTIGAFCRFLGDYVTDYKWLESAGSLMFALISLVVAYLVYRKFAEIADVFGLREEK